MSSLIYAAVEQWPFELALTLKIALDWEKSSLILFQTSLTVSASSNASSIVFQIHRYKLSEYITHPIPQADAVTAAFAPNETMITFFTILVFRETKYDWLDMNLPKKRLFCDNISYKDKILT